MTDRAADRLVCKGPIRLIVSVIVLTVLAPGLATSDGTEEAGGSLEIVAASDPLAVELEPVVRSWRSAVSGHDDAKVLDFALPEYRDRIERDLRASDSILRKDLYLGDGSLAKFFGRDLTTRLFRHRGFEKLGRGSTACYFDSKALSEPSPRTIADLPNVKDPNAVRCFFLFYDDGRWYISFDFSYR